MISKNGKTHDESGECMVNGLPCHPFWLRLRGGVQCTTLFYSCKGVLCNVVEEQIQAVKAHTSSRVNLKNILWGSPFTKRIHWI